MPTSPHVDVAAYVLGILDDQDDASFAHHFAHCPRCRAEYRELSDLPRLLDQIKPNRADRARSRPPAAPSKQVLARALEEIGTVRTQSRRRLNTRWLAAAAAAILVFGGAVTAWQLSGGSGSTPAPQAGAPSPQPSTPTSPTPTGTDVVAGARTVNATNLVTGAAAIIGIEPEPWGTRINLELRGVRGPMQCQLVAVTKTGATQTVTSFSVPDTGFGVPDSPEPLRITGNIGFPQEDLLRFDLHRDAGPDVLVIPA